MNFVVFSSCVWSILCGVFVFIVLGGSDIAVFVFNLLGSILVVLVCIRLLLVWMCLCMSLLRFVLIAYCCLRA